MIDTIYGFISSRITNCNHFLQSWRKREGIDQDWWVERKTQSLELLNWKKWWSYEVSNLSLRLSWHATKNWPPQINRSINSSDVLQLLLVEKQWNVLAGFSNTMNAISRGPRHSLTIERDTTLWRKLKCRVLSYPFVHTKIVVSRLSENRNTYKFHLVVFPSTSREVNTSIEKHNMYCMSINWNVLVEGGMNPPPSPRKRGDDTGSFPSPHSHVCSDYYPD